MTSQPHLVPPNAAAGQALIRAVAEHFGLQPEDLIRASNAREIVWPRQLAMYVCRYLLQLSYPKIGKLFGKNHTSVMYSIRKVEDRMRDERRRWPQQPLVGMGRHSETADLLANIIESVGRGKPR